MDRYIKRMKKEHVVMQLNKAVESVTVDAQKPRLLWFFALVSSL